MFSYLLSFANSSSAEFEFALHLSRIPNISNVSCSKQIKRFQSLSKICIHRQDAEPGLYLVKLCRRDKHCTTALLIKVPSLKVGVYLILEVHNTLVANVQEVKCKKWKVRHELQVTSYEFKFTSYEFKSASYEFKCRSQNTKNTSCKVKSTS